MIVEAQRTAHSLLRLPAEDAILPLLDAHFPIPALPTSNLTLEIVAYPALKYGLHDAFRTSLRGNFSI